MYQNYSKEERWEMVYESKSGEVKRCYPRSKEKVKENKAKLAENGMKLISCNKLYPFNTYKNQHNFELIHNIAMIELYDIYSGEKKASDEEYEKLEALKEQSEKFFMMPLPVAWVDWETWKGMKEMSDNAIIHRQNACIEAGRYDLVQYC